MDEPSVNAEHSRLINQDESITSRNISTSVIITIAVVVVVLVIAVAILRDYWCHYFSIKSLFTRPSELNSTGVMAGNVQRIAEDPVENAENFAHKIHVSSDRYDPPPTYEEAATIAERRFQ